MLSSTLGIGLGPMASYFQYATPMPKITLRMIRITDTVLTISVGRRTILQSISNFQFPVVLFPSNMCITNFKVAQSPGLPRYGHSVLEDTRAENRHLENIIQQLHEKLNLYEQDIEMQREQMRVRETEYEEDILKIKQQLSQGQRTNIQENIDVIRLQREVKDKSTKLSQIQAQFQNVEEKLHTVKTSHDQVLYEMDLLNNQLKEEQDRSMSLQNELKASSLSQRALVESKQFATRKIFWGLYESFSAAWKTLEAFFFSPLRHLFAEPGLRDDWFWDGVAAFRGNSTENSQEVGTLPFSGLHHLGEKTPCGELQNQIQDGGSCSTNTDMLCVHYCIWYFARMKGWLTSS
ncbi:hypothetical protein CAPTEDRAFT_218340 [Capitella teleta]|uniref:Uncharacterized protein n=1 Tax=Capitella teleta TaxID=283909 RepID=R7USK7_CAPTE|nr:hypothetical protein CAPTEDRAFT_218340 [Capitella teleta]|eukprot:ELU06907.1 hypothetical protein CAPTEDRAFT_218340 [Capitella teleta]